MPEFSLHKKAEDLEKNENLVLARMKTIGFDILDLCIKDQWVAIAGRYTKRRRAQGARLPA